MATAPASGYRRIVIPAMPLRTPAARVSRKPLHPPVRNERMTIPAPAPSSIHPSTTTVRKVVATAIPEAITPRSIKKTPNAKYQPHFRSISVSPVRNRFRAASKKLALLIQQNSFLQPAAFPRAGYAQKTSSYRFGRNTPVIGEGGYHRRSSVGLNPSLRPYSRYIVPILSAQTIPYKFVSSEVVEGVPIDVSCICRHGA